MPVVVLDGDESEKVQCGALSMSEASEQPLTLLGQTVQDLAATTDVRGPVRGLFDRLAAAMGLDLLLFMTMTADGRLRPACCFGIPGDAVRALELGEADEGVSAGV